VSAGVSPYVRERQYPDSLLGMPGSNSWKCSVFLPQSSDCNLLWPRTILGSGPRTASSGRSKFSTTGAVVRDQFTNFQNSVLPGPAVRDPTIFAFPIPLGSDEPDDEPHASGRKPDIPPFPFANPAEPGPAPRGSFRCSCSQFAGQRLDRAAQLSVFLLSYDWGRL
jgi:hypothetical protein